MTAEELVSALRSAVHDASIGDVLRDLERPPGRRPPPGLVALAGWYARLDAEGRERVAQVAALAVHAALFGVLAVLDGARTIDATGGRLALEWVARDGARTLLNDPARESLHDIYQGEVYAEVFGTDR